MPKQIWSEGRVVGESAYSIYVKQHLAVDPNTPPASEREWLASSIAMGSSLLLKIPANSSTGDRFVDIQLPHNSSLAAANTIVASFFDGEAHFPIDDQDTDSDTDDQYPWDKYWADRITDYGQLIANNENYSPNGDVTAEDDYSKLPTQYITTWSEHKQKQLIQYMNIIDGIVIQPGNWFNAPNQPPQKDFIPDLSYTHPRVRLHMRGSTSESPLVLLTGFTINSVLAGITGDEGSTNTDHPENGDFLGPTDFPWVAKIVFSVPNAFINYILTQSYKRKIDNTSVIVDDIPIVDMRATNPADFYAKYTDTSSGTNVSKYYSSDALTSIRDPRYGYTVQETSKAVNTSALTVYQKNQIFPPALYGTYVTSTGNTYLNPLDVVAPGTVKMFYNSVSTAQSYESDFPGTHALNLTSDGKLQYFYNNTAVTLAKNSDIPSTSLHTDYLYNADMHNSSSDFNYPGGSLSGTNRPKLLRTYTTDGKSAYSLMLSTGIANAGSDPAVPELTVKPSVGVTLTHNNSNDNIDWTALLSILRNSKSLDLLGDRLKETKYSLIKSEGWSKSSSPIADDYKHEYVYDSTRGLSYIPFGDDSDPKRLYILSGDDIMDDINNAENSDGTPKYLPDNFSHGGPDTTNIPAGSIAVGLGWHSIYRLLTQSNGEKAWTPSFGSEYDSGIIRGNNGGTNNKNYMRHSFSYGWIIVGRGEVSDGRSVTDEDVGKYYNAVISNYSASSNNWLYVAFVDRWSRVHILSKASDSNISITLRYKVAQDEESKTITKNPQFIRIQNNSYGPTRYTIMWMLIGQLTHRH